MKFEGIPCVGCGEIFTEKDDVVVCPVCGAPQHRACWLKENRCALEEKHAEGFVWENPHKEAPPAPAQPDAPKAADLFKRRQTCPYCGAPNTADAEVCANCGSSLLSQEEPRPGFAPGGEDPRREREAQIDDSLRPGTYENYRVYGGMEPDAMVDGIPCWEYSEYVSGGNPQSAPGRIILKVATMERYERKTSVCLPAFLFGPLWFFYRKMVKEGLAILLVQAILFAVFLVSGVSPAMIRTMREAVGQMREAAEDGSVIVDPNALLDGLRDRLQENMEEEEAAPSTGRIAVNVIAQTLLFPVLPILMSMFAVPLYRRKAKKDVLRIRTECGSMDEYRAALRQTGGTSLGLGVLAAVLTLVGYLAVSTLIWVPVLFG